MLKIADKDLSVMGLDDLRALSKRIKIAEKAVRLDANKKVAADLGIGDTVEFTLPKSKEILKGHVAKVKRVMIAIKSIDNIAQWNVPLTVVKKIASAPVKVTKSSAAVKAVKKNIAVKKASKKAVKAPVVKAEKKSAIDSINLIKAIKDKLTAKKATKATSSISAVEVAAE